MPRQAFPTTTTPAPAKTSMPTTPGPAQRSNLHATPTTLTPTTPGLAEPPRRATLPTLTPTTPVPTESRKLHATPAMLATPGPAAAGKLRGIHCAAKGPAPLHGTLAPRSSSRHTIAREDLGANDAGAC